MINIVRTSESYLVDINKLVIIQYDTAWNVRDYENSKGRKQGEGESSTGL